MGRKTNLPRKFFLKMSLTAPLSVLDRQAPPLKPRPASIDSPVAFRAPANRLQRKFMIFSPYCDQGLGVQARAYLYWLHKLKYGACIFANATRKRSIASQKQRPKERKQHQQQHQQQNQDQQQNQPTLQANTSEWKMPRGVTVHYSNYDREAQPWQEVAEFAKCEGVTDALMLETAHNNIFVVSAALYRHANVRVWAVPNIEMVRRQELIRQDLYSSEVFCGVLCPTEYSREVINYLQKQLQSQTRSFPFALPLEEPKFTGLKVKQAAPYDGMGPVRFLLVGGLNAISRKQADKVMSAFAMAFPTPGRATLTILTQKPEPVLRRYSQRTPSIIVSEQHFTYQQILDAYGQHHVVIMVSRAEGIGIGVYEAMRAGCALLVLKNRMFTDLVSADINGWIVPCKAEPDTVSIEAIGNSDPVVRTYSFQNIDLQNMLQYVVGQPQEVVAKQQGARMSYEKLFADDRVIESWRQALSIDMIHRQGAPKASSTYGLDTFNAHAKAAQHATRRTPQQQSQACHPSSRFGPPSTDDLFSLNPADAIQRRHRPMSAAAPAHKSQVRQGCHRAFE